MDIYKEPRTAVYAGCLPWPALRLPDLHCTLLTDIRGVESKAGRKTFSHLRETAYDIVAAYAFTGALLNLHVLACRLSVHQTCAAQQTPNPG